MIFNNLTLEFLIRILAASIIGGAIGLEREYRAKEAGLRTHFLVALGSALFMIVSQFGFKSTIGYEVSSSLDPSRIASQVVTGIGFIGAGIIIFQKHVVRGLTTAAGLWVTSAIGLTCGAGLYILSFTTMLLVLVCMEVLHIVVRHVEYKTISATFISTSPESVRSSIEILREKAIEMRSYNIKQKNQDSYLLTIEMCVRDRDIENIIKMLLSENNGLVIKEIG